LQFAGGGAAFDANVRDHQAHRYFLDTTIAESPLQNWACQSCVPAMTTVPLDKAQKGSEIMRLMHSSDAPSVPSVTGKKEGQERIEV